MNQIISQHGWGLDSSFWKYLKNQFILNNWLWQDNERGYFFSNVQNSQWAKKETKNFLKVVICHSLGIHLIEKELIASASHVVLINSFCNFIPNNMHKELTIKSLKRMEKKMDSYESIEMLKEFLHRSFLPNNINKNFLEKYIPKLQNINTPILKNDFKKLYFEGEFNKLFSKNCSILIIKSKNDHILRESSANNLIRILNKTQIKKPKVVELTNQGHIIDNLDIFKIIADWTTD